MSYLLTGCNGLLGGHIARLLLKKGEKVLALKRKSSDLSFVADIQGAIEWIEGDILDYLMLEEAVHQADMVIHAAGLVSFQAKDRKKLYKVNAEGTANVVNACIRAGQKPLCHISSVAALGKPPQQKVINEATRWDATAGHSDYAFSKNLGEQEVWRGVEEGLPAVILNPSVVLGAGNWQRSSLQLLNHAASQPAFYPPGILNYVDARNVAQAVYLVLQQELFASRFVLNAGHVPYATFYQQVAERLGLTPPLKTFTRWQARLAQMLSVAAKAFGPGKQVLSRDMLKSAFNEHKMDGSSICRTTGLHYHTLSETLDWACAEQQHATQAQ